MTTATCTKCGTTVPVAQINYSPVGAFCGPCLTNETSDSDRLEKEFLRATGRRQLFIGLVMLALGGGVLMLSSAGGSLMLIPTGLLLGGVYELAMGVSKL